jgi:hypothetical protein
MTLEFTYTLEDYVEAARAHAAGPVFEVKGRRFPRNLLVAMLILGIAVAFFLLSPKPPPAGGPAPPPAPVGTPTFARQLMPAVPALLVISFVWFLYSQRVRRPQKHQERRRSFLYATGSEPRRRPQNTWPAAILALARNYQHGWESQPQLHRPQSMEVEEETVVISDAATRAEHRWDAFSHVLETSNLFLLYTSDHAFHMVPKRAFASEQDVRSFRELVRRTIAERPAPAFPVIVGQNAAGAG